MKKKFLVFGFVLSLFLSSCTRDVDTVSSPSIGEEEKMTVVITKAEDVILKSMTANVDDTESKEQIKLLFDSESYIILEINQAQIIVGNDIYHMINSENDDRKSSYDIKLIDDKLFVINEYKNVSSDHEDININCYEFVDGDIVEVWNSKSLIDLIVTENKDDKNMLYISNKDFKHSLTLEAKVYSKVMNNKDNCNIHCSLGDSFDYRFLDYDGDGRDELLVKGSVNLGNQTINPFYRVYNIAETLELEYCGFYNTIEAENYFN